MYAKCGRIDLGHLVFSMMKERDSICWNSVITSCSQNVKPEVAIDLSRSMGMEGAEYDPVSISAALSACSNLSALHYGKQIHSFMIQSSFNHDIFADSAVIDMYAKCGNLDLAQHDEGFQPDHVTFLAIISAFGHSGQVEEGKCYFNFNIMTQNYGIPPRIEHYACLIDMLGRYDRLEVALRVIKGMPFAPDAGIWGTLLDACRVHERTRSDQTTWLQLD
ncbi:pentatricopeptide repeat-containing protein At4g21300-like [Primulina huaijiensis]|uniref:pentatricopeptide repeat-containing protein At4g21300-like n=1 Tax=Primulina huaijiensis TaxID=1492673 RepID=UPI003CC75184